MTDSRKPHRIQVFLKLENPSTDLAKHSASKTLALLVLAACAAKRIRPDAIQLVTVESWREVKQRVRPNVDCRRKVLIPKLLPPPDYGSCLLLSYPPKGYESNAAQIQREVWMRATKF